MAVSRKKSSNRPDPKVIEGLIEQEIVKDPDRDLKTHQQGKKLAKSDKANPDYHKTMFYLQIEVRERLELLAFQNKRKGKDMSDIVNELLCKEFDLEFRDS